MKNIIILILIIVSAVSVFAQGKKPEPKVDTKLDTVQVILIPEFARVRIKSAQAQADQLQRQIDNLKSEVQGVLLGVILSTGLDPNNIKGTPTVEEDKITIIKKTP